MPSKTRSDAPPLTSHVNALAPLGLQPLELEVISEKGKKTFELTVSDMKKIWEAKAGFFERWIDECWDAIRDYFCGTKRTEAKVLFGAAMRAEDHVTMAKNYFALREMATPATQNARFSEVVNTATGEVTLSIEVQLKETPRVTMCVAGAALPSREAERLNLPLNVILAAWQREDVLAEMPHVVPPKMPHVVPAKLSDVVLPKMSNVVPAKLSVVVPPEMPDVMLAEMPGVVPDKMSDFLTSWAKKTCDFTGQGVEHAETLIQVGKKFLRVYAPYSVDVEVDERMEQRVNDWGGQLECESPPEGQCIYEVDLGNGRPIRSENVGATRIDSDANERIAFGLLGAISARKITSHQASAVAFLMRADNAPQTLMDLAAVRTPSFDRGINGWACRHHFSIMRNGPDMVVSITSESKLSDEQLFLSETGAQPSAPPQTVTFRQQWVVDPTGGMRCLLATAEAEPAERTITGLTAPDDEGSFLGAPEVGGNVPKLFDIDVGALSASGTEISFLSVSDVDAGMELSRSFEPHTAAFRKWYGALTPSARKLLVNCKSLRGFVPRVLAFLSGDNAALAEPVARYMTGKAYVLPAGLAMPDSAIPKAVKDELSGLLDVQGDGVVGDNASPEQIIALLHRLNLELWVDSLDPQYQHGFA